MTPEDRVRDAAARHDDGSGDIVASALHSLARRQERAGKDCPRCDVRKPLGAFGADSSKPDGLRSWCRECRRPQRRPCR